MATCAKLSDFDQMTEHPNARSTNLYIHARISQALFASTKKHCSDEDRSLSSVVRIALKEYLDARGYDTDGN